MKKIIISLTSFPARAKAAAKVIRQMNHQTLSPDKIVLYLTADQFPKNVLPIELKKLCDENLCEIRFYKRPIKSYTKLIPALTDFPNDIIITIDDDIDYPSNLIETLYNTHIKKPNIIIGCDVRRISKGKSYKKWRKIQNRWWRTVIFKSPSFKNFAAGVGGILYPPHTLYKDVLREDLFLELARDADDVWFWAMAVLNGTKIMLAPKAEKKVSTLKGSQTVALWSGNSQNDRNNKILDAIIKYYPKLEKII